MGSLHTNLPNVSLTKQTISLVYIAMLHFLSQFIEMKAVREADNQEHNAKQLPRKVKTVDHFK